MNHNDEITILILLQDNSRRKRANSAVATQVKDNIVMQISPDIQSQICNPEQHHQQTTQHIWTKKLLQLIKLKIFGGVKTILIGIIFDVTADYGTAIY